MALATLQWYGPGLKRVIDGEIDFNGHTFKAVLLSSSYTPNRDTDDDLSDVITYEVTGTGWTTGGETLTVTTGINTGSVNPALYALERKGMIMLAKPGDQTAAAIYQILQPVEGA
mgnify:CR=1 FL=1